MKDRLPDFLIVGAAKSGTTSLYYYLSEHPEIYVSKMKEPHFFAFADKQISRKKLKQLIVVDKISDYEKLFQLATTNQKKGEASTYYLPFFQETISNIKLFYGHSYNKVKIIAILRNPIQRAFSQYLMLYGWGEEKLDFTTAISSIKKRMKEEWPYEFDYILSGLYYEPVKAYLNNFENVKIYLFEDLKERPLWLLNDVLQFLQVDNHIYSPNINKKYNVSGIAQSKFHKLLYEVATKYNPAKPLVKRFVSEDKKGGIRDMIKKYLFITPQIDEENSIRLKEIYKENILKLQVLIKRDLSNWLK